MDPMDPTRYLKAKHHYRPKVQQVNSLPVPETPKQKNALLIPGVCFLMHITLQGMDTYPTEREKENHLQNAIFGGYVSSLEGNMYTYVFFVFF